MQALNYQNGDYNLRHYNPSYHPVEAVKMFNNWLTAATTNEFHYSYVHPSTQHSGNRSDDEGGFTRTGNTVMRGNVRKPGSHSIGGAVRCACPCMACP